MRLVKFKNRSWDIAAHLHLPDNFDETLKYSAIVCIHPGGSVKEQTAGLYAEQLAKKGFIALAYDASFQGESGGEPRSLEDPTQRVEDIRYAVDYLTTLNFVGNNSIGLLGICAGGGYAVNAALKERRIKAVATVSGINIGRAFRESDFLETLEVTSSQRTAEASGADPMITHWTPKSVEDTKQAGLSDMDMLEAIDYYRTPRGEYPTSNNQLLLSSMANLIVFDAFHLTELLLTQPLLIVVGDKVGSFGSYRDGYDLHKKAVSKNKKIHIVNGAGHYDLYDQPEATAEALDHLVPFFQENLSLSS